MMSVLRRELTIKKNSYFKKERSILAIYFKELGKKKKSLKLIERSKR